MTRSGFTAVELMIVIILIGLIAAVGFPKIRDTLDKTNVRSARVAVGTYTVTARSLAIQRGCRAVVHFSYGTSSGVWATSCRPGVATIDTVGQVKNVYQDFNVTMTATQDSVQFDPRGLSLETANTIVYFTGNVSSITDSIVIASYTGKVVR
jgi:prepilin-type N-terminal cleavage/methylation domain-containing protein